MRVRNMEWSSLSMMRTVSIDLDNLTKIFEIYQNGGSVISVGTLPSSATDSQKNEAVREIIRQMFGEDADATCVSGREIPSPAIRSM